MREASLMVLLSAFKLLSKTGLRGRLKPSRQHGAPLYHRSSALTMALATFLRPNEGQPTQHDLKKNVRSLSPHNQRPVTRYNLVALKLLRLSAIIIALTTVALAQGPATGQTVLVVPFENQSKAPGIEWVGDSFPELLQERLNSPTLFVLPREDRIRAYDRLGIPAELHPSRATIYRIAEQLDVDLVVLGLYNFDGRTFTTTAQVLDMHRQKLLPEMHEAGPLVQLIDIQTALAWDILHTLQPEASTNGEAFMASAPPIRLDAFENYIRGVTAPNTEEQIQHFREAVRLNPTYVEALLRLGKASYQAHQDDLAVASLARVPQEDARANEANFYLGLAAYTKGDFPRAESAFRAVASRLPLAEVYNNLGVVTARDHRKAAEEYFQKAIDADPNDPDYHFNLAIELNRNGDAIGASRQLRETLALKPSDSEAKALLDAISSNANTSAHVPRGMIPASESFPLERVRTNYDESSFRLLV